MGEAAARRPRPFSLTEERAEFADSCLFVEVKLFYTGPVINAETLVMMLEKHGITAMHEFVDATPPADDDDLNRPARVLVPEADYDRAYQLFYAEREDEL